MSYPAAGPVVPRLCRCNIKGMVSKGLRTCLAVATMALFLALAACAPNPPRPAMAALAQTGEFGYAERKLDDDRYEVSYTTPRLRTSAYTGERSADVEVEKQRARDLALWRAAQLAQQAGYPALRIQSDSRDADVTLRHDPDPFYDPWGHPYLFPGRGYRPYYPYYGYGPGVFHSAYRTDASARVTSKLVVEFLRQPSDDSLDAAATVRDLSAKYAAATYPGTSY